MAFLAGRQLTVGQRERSVVMRGHKVQVSSNRSTYKRLNTDVFSSTLEETESWMNIHGAVDELCSLQHRATLKALMLLLLSQEVLATEPHGPQHGAPASNYHLIICGH
ncbi:hypothetical protein PBY51_012087 [Eleginops maclovinus]|uniref:Uncharacterized protein n=1 Tax=Eleginops maclovinus TaxID=56733 RepID=A0AAN7XPI2_ELEMC|nr:hypothetical protein PBY51_012087 [Eleginops maclovinus]